MAGSNRERSGASATTSKERFTKLAMDPRSLYKYAFRFTLIPGPFIVMF